LREPDAFCLRWVAFFQDGLIHALRAKAFSYGLGRSLLPWCIGIGSLETFPLIVLGQASLAGGAITLLGVIRAALARMHDAGVHALLGQALRAILALAGHQSVAALDIAAMGAGACALLILEGMLAAVHMACGALLHFLRVVAGVTHVLLAELTLHDGLLQARTGGQREGAFRVPGLFRNFLSSRPKP
jgi:hypothetical protein